MLTHISLQTVVGDAAGQKFGLLEEIMQLEFLYTTCFDQKSLISAII